MIEKWKVLESKEIISTKLFRLRVDRCELPNKKIMPTYYVSEWPTWVNIVALDEKKNFILVEQYRHASGQVSLEVPGGMVDKNELSEPIQAAHRELQEETGYSSPDLKLIGSHYPNPASQDNMLYTYLALNCRKTSEMNLDPYENIELHLMPKAQVLKKIDSGEINHSLIVASLFMAMRFIE